MTEGRSLAGMEREWRTMDAVKVRWKPGPWHDEPDKVQWIDEATGLDCMALRHHAHGSWCGYVGVPPGHPLHGADAWEPPACNLDAHGGLTFSGGCEEGGDIALTICHVPEPGRPADVWWLGFDCSHAWDLVPGMMFGHDEYPPEVNEALARVAALDFPYVHYRTLGYVRQECAGLAAQVASA